MLKILVIHNRYRDLGGEDLAVENEVSFLSKEYEVETIYFDNKIINIFDNIVSLITGSNPKSLRKLEEEYSKFNPDIVYVHNTWFNASVGIFNFLEQKNIKVLLKLHNFRYFCTRFSTSKKHFSDSNSCQACGLFKKDMGYINKYFSKSFLKSIVILIYGKRYFNILKKCKIELVVLTKFHKNFLTKLGIPNSKITVIPNTLELDYFKSSNSKSLDLIYAGRISVEKGIQELIDAFVDADLPEINLKIIGEGPLLKHFQKKYSQKNLIFTGVKTNNETRKTISSSLCVVTATKLFEGQPTLLTEASLMGIPSIFPDSEGIKEFFPQDTRLAFKQFDYKDLSKKMMLLKNNEFLKAEGFNNQKFINKKLDGNMIHKEFQKLFLKNYQETQK
jgi:glycosyltransferase involved in cell wall biosynthesis